MYNINVVLNLLNLEYKRTTSTIERHNMLHELTQFMKELRAETVEKIENDESIVAVYDEITFKTLVEVIENDFFYDSNLSWVNINTALTELNLDSLDYIEMLMCVEEHFEIEIPDAIAETFVTVQDVVSYISKINYEN